MISRFSCRRWPWTNFHKGMLPNPTILSISSCRSREMKPLGFSLRCPLSVSKIWSRLSHRRAAIKLRVLHRLADNKINFSVILDKMSCRAFQTISRSHYHPRVMSHSLRSPRRNKNLYLMSKIANLTTLSRLRFPIDFRSHSTLVISRSIQTLNSLTCRVFYLAMLLFWTPKRFDSRIMRRPELAPRSAATLSHMLPIQIRA